MLGSKTYPIASYSNFAYCTVYIYAFAYIQSTWRTIQIYLSYDWLLPLIFGGIGGINYIYVQLKTNGLNDIAVFCGTIKQYVAD